MATAEEQSKNKAKWQRLEIINEQQSGDMTVVLMELVDICCGNLYSTEWITIIQPRITHNFSNTDARSGSWHQIPRQQGTL